MKFSLVKKTNNHNYVPVTISEPINKSRDDTIEMCFIKILTVVFKLKDHCDTENYTKL